MELIWNQTKDPMILKSNASPRKLYKVKDDDIIFTSINEAHRRKIELFGDE